ncbi:GreA/GreB family elongation factor [Inhella proteolytica]|uniref:GreA/GreB family elongation factor n=1 Tax=Inhella proteolytica TaxID=2795029 RepID=A0A931J0N4_9BURK|nr:GreA/GreB family elongation factor [Inhella proteolytica]MBH9576191.1 GreA/GreB family elongation factor [Inhella proteolytica]
MTAVLSGELLLTELDFARLLKLNSAALRELLDDASALPSPEIPADVVTMNSRVLVSDDARAAPQTLTLCYPPDADPHAGRVSVLSPVGAALLGRRVGSEVSWRTPTGERRALRIEALLFQPEASGDYLA